jgi:hypothetical protein
VDAELMTEAVISLRERAASSGVSVEVSWPAVAVSVGMCGDARAILVGGGGDAAVVVFPLYSRACVRCATMDGLTRRSHRAEFYLRQRIFSVMMMINQVYFPRCKYASWLLQVIRHIFFTKGAGKFKILIETEIILSFTKNVKVSKFFNH